MKERNFLICLFGAIAAFILRSPAADLSQATIRQKVNVVTVADSLSAKPHPAESGAIVKTENVVRTGSESRAELEFTDTTLARMGANSLFSFDSASRALEFQKGSLLFSKPTQSGRIDVRSASVTAAITGSTGFITKLEKRGQAYGLQLPSGTQLLGMLEGRARGTAQWTDPAAASHAFPFTLRPGQILIVIPEQIPVVVDFDLPTFVATSPLIIGFRGALLNPDEMAAALKDYRRLVADGFIEPATTPVEPVDERPLLVGDLTDPSGKQVDVSTIALTPVASMVGVALPAAAIPPPVNPKRFGIIRSNLTWAAKADLDLILRLPGGKQVFFTTPKLVFNNGKATVFVTGGPTIGNGQIPPGPGSERIVVRGQLPPGKYTFTVRNVESPQVPVTYQLSVAGFGKTLIQNAQVLPNQTSAGLTIQPPKK